MRIRSPLFDYFISVLDYTSLLAWNLLVRHDDKQLRGLNARRMGISERTLTASTVMIIKARTLISQKYVTISANLICRIGTKGGNRVRNKEVSS